MMRYLRHRMNTNLADLETLIKFTLRETHIVDGKPYYYYQLLLNYLHAALGDLQILSGSIGLQSTSDAKDLSGELPKAFIELLDSVKVSVLESCEKHEQLNPSQMEQMEQALSQLITELLSDLRLFKSFLTPMKGYSAGETPVAIRPNEMRKNDTDDKEDKDIPEFVEQNPEDVIALQQTLIEKGIYVHRVGNMGDENNMLSLHADMIMVRKQLALLEEHSSFRFIYGLEGSIVEADSRAFIAQVNAAVVAEEKRIIAEKQRIAQEANQSEEKEKEKEKEQEKVPEQNTQLRQMPLRQYHNSSYQYSQVRHASLFGQQLYFQHQRATVVPNPKTNPFKSG